VCEPPRLFWGPGVSTHRFNDTIGSEDPDEAEKGEQTILQTLLEAISIDPSAYVPPPHSFTSS